MITVLELLSHPAFAEFSLQNSTQGLYNRISGTGILEWEREPSDIASFSEGNFVLTTLAFGSGDMENAWKIVKSLIDCRVSGIAIKDLFITAIPQTVLDYADQYNVPLFLFPQAYIDDIIYIIKSLIDTGKLNALYAEKIKRLLPNKGEGPLSALSTLEMNPYFYDNFLCCTCLPASQAEEERSALMDLYYKKYLRHSKSVPEEGIIYAAIRMSFGFVVILTQKYPAQNLHKNMQALLHKLELDTKEFCVGFSGTYSEAALLGDAVLESIYTGLTCRQDARASMKFSETGFLQFLPSIAFSPWTDRYWQKYYTIIAEYDDCHSSSLLQTLHSYGESYGDIAATAKQQYQHSNTIRYRLEKIKQLLNIENAPDSNYQLYVFYKLCQIRSMLSQLDTE